MKVVELVDPDERARACGALPRSLLEWFGIEAAIESYEREVRELPTFAAREDGDVAGALALKLHNEWSGEILVMAVRRDLHGRGLGRQLVAATEGYAGALNVEYVRVKTLGPSRPSAGHETTRRFYEACGFRPLEEIDGLWPGNPCLVIFKRLDR
jgi:GNAT superfamily N-acetyltransferase